MSTVEGPLLWEGIWMIIRNGGCHCDPPGCGMEFCTGHCYLRADLEAARTEIEQLNQARDMIVEEREAWKASAQQSRATEAELRARIERRDAVVEAVRAWKEQHWDLWRPLPREYPWQVQATEFSPRHKSDAALVNVLAALDVAEQPARAQDGPQQP